MVQSHTSAVHYVLLHWGHSLHLVSKLIRAVSILSQVGPLASLICMQKDQSHLLSTALISLTPRLTIPTVKSFLLLFALTLSTPRLDEPSPAKTYNKTSVGVHMKQ